jgi:uncharacterized protein
MDIQPVPGIPALKMDGCLIIGDLHIGVETHLMRKGFHIASRTDMMFDAIIEAAGTDINRIVMLGDIKDSVPGSTKQEYREIPVFCDRLLERFDRVDIIRGNHDTNLEEFVPDRISISPATGMRIGDVGLVHGHTWPSVDVMSSRTLLLAHSHPTVLFVDGVGGHSSEPCWMRGKFRVSSSDSYNQLPEDFVLIPAFNRILGGSPVNIVGEPLLGPVLNSGLVDIDNAEIHLLDGISLGKRSDLMVEGRKFRKWDDRENRKHTYLGI